MVLKIALRIHVDVTEQGMLNADYDKSGDVTLIDAQLTLKRALKIIGE